MPKEKPLYTLYKGLKQNNYDVPDNYESFERTLTSGGDGGASYAAKSRHALYNALKEQNYDVPDSYERFYSTLFEPVSNTTSRARGGEAEAQPQPTKPSAQPASQQPKPKGGGGMTPQQRAAFIQGAQNIVDSSAQNVRRTQNRMTYQRANSGLKVNPGGRVTIGQNPKVVEVDSQGNPVRGQQFELPGSHQGHHYVTESGNEFENRGEADVEQNLVDQYRSEQNAVLSLDDAYKERDRLSQLLEQRGKELDAENLKPSWRDMPRGGGAAVHTMNSMDANGRFTDTEYLQLFAAKKANDERIRDLEAARDEKTGTFLGGLWRGFRDYAFDLSNWDSGFTDLIRTSAMLRSKAGMSSTDREKEAERSMMENTYKAGAAAQKAEQELGNGYRWARIGAQSLPFALQFMAGSVTGLTTGIARGGEAMGVRMARNIAMKEGSKNIMRNLGRTVLKNTGVMLGDLGAATALSTTLQAGQTTSDALNRYIGDVTYDPETGDYKLEGGKSLGRSLYEGLANQTIENYTEMLGEHIHLGKFASSALTKMGLGRVSNWFTKVGKTDFMQGVNKYLEMAGFNGYPQEVMEEEIGIPLHAIFDGGNKFSDLLDGRQQLDIVGGMLFSMAGMGGAAMTLQGGRRGAMAMMYQRDQHKLNDADHVASFRLTADKWAPIKEQIDNTTNEDFGKVMQGVLSSDDLSQQEKEAVWDYAQKLITMRGHNMGQEAATRNGMIDRETNAANESYTEGYNTTDASAMNDARNRIFAAQQRLDDYMEQAGKDTWKDYPDMLAKQHDHIDPQTILDAKWNDGTPMYDENDNVRQMAQDVVNAQQEYEGMLQRVRDDMDDEVQQTSILYDQRTNPQTGMIQQATLKAQNPDGTDRKVYVTSGNIVMMDDGQTVDRQKSDMSVVIVDDEGKVEMISPEQIFSLDTPINGEEAKQQAFAAIQAQRQQEAQDKIDGKVQLTPNATYPIVDDSGQQSTITLVPNAETGLVQNEDGTVNVSIDGYPGTMSLDDLQRWVDNANMLRTTQAEADRQAEQAAEQEQPSYPVQQEPHQWEVDDTFTITDNEGQPVRGQVTGISADGIEIYTETPLNGKKMQVVTPEQLEQSVTQINGQNRYEPTEVGNNGGENIQVSGNEGAENIREGNENAENGNFSPENGNLSPESGNNQAQNIPQRAIDRIPYNEVDDGKGNVRTVHQWEQAEPGDTYDALTEIYHGNADRVKKGVQNRISAIDKQIKSTQKKMDAIDNSDDFDAVAAQGEQYDALQQQKDALEQQRKYWQSVQNVPVVRRAAEDRRTEAEKAAAKAAREKAEAEAAEQARIERERVNGVPDVINDTPSDARKRGFRNVNGMVVERQQPTEGVTGRESNVKFSSSDTAKGRVKVIEADQLQPSHVSGQRNPLFFIDEAQPKDRTDAVSSMAAAKIASNLNPEEITGDGSAYQFSSPTVNSRGEVIQGNNRSDALKLMYSTPAFKPAQDAYKQYMIDHAEDFGFTPEDVQKIQQMQKPVMVNELDVNDDEAIRLGQMKASDNESGGIERIDPVTTSQKLGAKVSSFANVLLSSPDENASLSDVLMQNGGKTIKWLQTQDAISDTAAQSAFDRKGNLTPEARMDLLNILKQSLFQGGVSDLGTMFDRMPAKAQKAILNTFMRDFDSAESERILPEIQKAIEAWYGCANANEAFAKAPNYKAAKAAMHDWTLQTNLLDNNMPSDKFSNFAMELACRMQGCSMRETQQNLNDFFDLVQGKSQGDLFGGTTAGEQADRQEAIRRIFNIDYQPINNNVNGENGSNAVADNDSQSGEGRPGSTGDGADRERAAEGGQQADVAGGTESVDEGINKGAVRTKDGGYTKLPTGYAYRITDAQELKDVIDNGAFRKMPDDKIVPGSDKTYTSKSGRTFSFGKQGGNSHGGKAFAAGMPWGDNGNGGTTSGGFTGERYYIAIPGNNVDGWKVGHHGHYSEPKPFDEIEEGNGLWLPFDEDGEVSDLSTKGMRVFRKEGDTYYEVEHPEEIVNNTVAQPIGATSTSEHVEGERQVVNTEPSDAQKEAGNYKKGHIKVDGYDITIENPKGSTRSGKDASGKAWSVPMHYDYGYILGTEGVDGDHIDVYLSDNPTSGNVYVVDQINQQDGSFDEHKVMYGFPSMDAAIDAYKSQYEDGWKVGTVTEVSREDFKKWVESSHRKTKPFAEYKANEEKPKQDGEAVAQQQRTEQEQPQAPIYNERTVLKNNLAGGDAYINIVGNPESGYDVRYYDNREEADINYPLAIGTETMTADQLMQHLNNGDFTTVEQTKPKQTAAKPKKEAEAKPQRTKPKRKQQKQEPKKNEGQFGLVSDERMEELKKRLRAKLSNLNMGVDPEVLAIGLELTAGYIDRGVKKFADYGKAMIADLGDVVRPYLKAFYNGVRDMPEITSNGLDSEMDDYDTVSKFNVATIGKEGEEAKPSLIETAEQISNESQVQRKASQEMEMHQVDVMGLMADLSRGRTTSLNEHFTDNDADAATKAAHDNMMKQLDGIYKRDGRQAIEGIINDRDHVIDFYKGKLDRGETQGEAYGSHAHVDYARSLARAIGEREAAQEFMDNGFKTKPQTKDNSLVQAAQETGHLVVGGVPKAEEKKEQPKEGTHGYSLRKATQQDLEGNPDVYVDGQRHRIMMLVRTGQQVSVAQFSAPYIEAVYLENNERVPVDKLEVEDIPSTVHLKTVGDFYEAYGNDAVALGLCTGVTVTQRKNGEKMAGFPKRALDEYEQNMLDEGLYVAIDGKLTDKTKAAVKAEDTKAATQRIKEMLQGGKKTDTAGKKKQQKDKKSQKKSVSSQQKQPSFFGDLFGGEETQQTTQEAEPSLFDEQPQAPVTITTDDEQGKEKPIEQHPEKELSGESKEYQQRVQAEKEFVDRIKGMITDAAKEGRSLTMTDIKKAYKDELDGNWELPDDYADTDLQELVERAMTLATREVAIERISQNTPEAVREGYDMIVKLYNAQPSLNARDSSRIEHQQYSTPTPFGYVMDWFLRNGNRPIRGLEPSAGNGALTIGFPAALWHVNDIDERRLMNLRTMPYLQITNQDGTLPFEPKAYDMVATNPPFGTTDEKVFDGGRTKINSLEGLMAINALASMKDNGRAAIIIGGNTQYMPNGAMQSKDMKLFRHLYTHYNVVDVINLDGDMYKRNGTGYNVRMILIAGRKTDVSDNPEQFTFPPVRKKARAEQVKSFDELYKRVEDDIEQAKQMERESALAARRDGSQRGQRMADGTGNSEAAGGVRGQSVRTGTLERRTQPGRSLRPSSAQDGRRNGERAQHGSSDRLDNADGRDAGSNNAVPGNRPAQRQSWQRGESLGDGRGRVGGDERGGASERSDTDGERLAITNNAVASDGAHNGAAPSAPRQKVELGQEKVAYPNKSRSMTLQSRVPAAQAEAIAENLDRLGDVDEMVRSELGYSSKDELFSHLAAEQIDSVALAIDQMKQGKGFIIGDMTGVGKGRQGAALIRWAVRQGTTPIYFTQKPTLFTDNYRDMKDIGSGELRPLIIASDKEGNIVENVLNENGEKTYDKNGDPVTRVVHGILSKKKYEKVYDYILREGKLPPEYDYVLVTYSQIQNGTLEYTLDASGNIQAKAKKGKGKGKSKGSAAAAENGDIRREVIEKLARNNYVFLDESHTVGGQSSSGLYMQSMLNGAAGVTYLSATFAKRPDNMPLYAMKTAMSESGLSQKDMIDAINKGGVTLQEIMSRQLVQSGQMIRRERDFTGVTIDWEGVDEETDKKQRAQFDEVAKIFNAIREFQDTYVDPTIEKMSEEMAEEGKAAKKTQGTSHMGVNNVPFASKMYNLVNQLLFSLKADAVADKAIEQLKAGKKPVISFSNTMEGFLDELPKNTPMDELPDFSLTLMKALEGTLRYTEGEIGNKDNQIKKTLSFNSLDEEAQERYNEIRRTILSLSIGLPIDPMDAIKMRIEAAGYKVGEITGRKTEMVRDADGRYVVRSRSSKDMDGKAAAAAFNATNGKKGGLDVLLINKSGSTGISLHASSRFTDQHQRVMIAAQFQSDINDEVQMRGRIDRTGQVSRGQYIYLVSSIPAEQRLQMMFKNKLKSLDANTTSSQKSKFNEMEVTDFMNKYGDEVTWSYMMEHPDLEERLGDPLDMLADESKKKEGGRSRGDDESNPKNGCAAKILRRLPFLSVAEQETIFKEISEAYKVKLQLLNDAGENDLEITTMPLRAETKQKKVWKQGSDPESGNAFADNTYLEQVEVDVLKKPMKADEVRTYADRLTDGEDWQTWKRKQHEAIDKFFEEKKQAVRDKAEESAKKRAAKVREDYIKGCLKARKKGDNTWSDEEIGHMADIAVKEFMDKERAKADVRTDKIDKQVETIYDTLDFFTPLEPCMVPLNLSDAGGTLIPSLGTFIGIKFNKSYSTASSTAVFATLDGRRKVELPLNDSKSLEAIRRNSVMYSWQTHDLNMDNWDSRVPTKSRRTAYIVTGNLMQALVDTQKDPTTRGQIISYTTIDGDVKQGILMNDRFKEENLRTSAPISSMIKEIMQGDTIESENGEVKIEKSANSRGWYKLFVPKSKQKGGKYFLDKKLLKFMADGEFSTKGSNMVGEFMEPDLKKVLDYLSKQLGVTVLQKADLQTTETNDTPTTPEEAEEGDVLYREVDDEEQARLDAEPTVKVYRAMQQHDGKLYPPMSGRVREEYTTKNGKKRNRWTWREPTAIGRWEQSEEHPERANDDGTFTLDKGNGKTIDAAYNPYIHTSRSPINDQFSSAWSRPELVTVEVEVPLSELSSGYKAEKAKDAVGEVPWKSGPVSSELAAQGNPRLVILSRWDKPVRIVPVEEVADEYAMRLASTGIAVPFNTVPPALRDALAARGVEIGEPQNGNAGNASRPSYEEWMQGRTREREGSGAYTDEELSYINDPVAKWLGKSQRTKAQQKAFADRERKSMETSVRDMAARLHLDNVEIVTEPLTVTDRRGKVHHPKGFYNKANGKITIVIPSHANVEDALQTLLHEGVAHYGLRKLFGSHFDTFLDNVYAAADNDVRRRITELALRKYGGDFHVATEEYLASLAEQTDFENMPRGFWQKVKDFFLDMLHAIGFEGFADSGVTLSDNELRYILWRSYENLKEPGRYRSILGEAEDVAKQAELKVGNYAAEDAAMQRRTQPEGERAAEGVAEGATAPDFHTVVDEMYTNPDFDRSGHLRERYDLGKTPDWMKKIGITGDNFSLSFKNIKTHQGKDADHDLTREEWHELPDAIQHPFLVTQYKGQADRYRLYVNILHNGHYVAVGVDVKRVNQGKSKPILEVNSIKTVFAKGTERIADDEVIKAYDKKITPEQEALLHGHNFREYPSIQELESGSSDGLMSTTSPKRSATTPDNSTPSAAKVSNNSESSANNSEKVSEPRVWGKKDLLSKAEQVTEGIEPDLLFRDSIEDDDDTARAAYDKWADAATSQAREAWQDSMISVRNLQRAVLRQRGETMEDFEDAYEEENRSHGRGQDLADYFRDNLYKPLYKSVSALAKAAKVSVGDVTQYMMAKHGLERNEVFAKRDAQAAWERYQEKQKERFAEYQKAHPNGNKTIADFMEKGYDDFYNQYREKDYSGLTELTGTDNVQDAEAEAKRIVADMEGRNGAAPYTADLWQNTNAATKWTLEQAFRNGIISKANYEQVRDMFKWYIPLRGWSDDTAEDIYDYVGSGNNGTSFSPTVRKAHGRKTVADNPIAYIASMGISSIVQGMRNKYKQSFLGFVENHPTNLVTVSEMWYRNHGTEQNPDWYEDVPNIPEDATADEVAAIVEQHEKDMEALAAQGLATKERGRLHLSVPIRKGQALEHHVEVMVNGKKYVLYINGNPRAAQALNGTRSRRASEHGVTSMLDHIADSFDEWNTWLGKRLAWLTRLLSRGQRQMGANFTSRNPAFMLGNAFRDVDMALAVTAIKEPLPYMHRFRMALLNLTLNPMHGGLARMFTLKHWYGKYKAKGGDGTDLKGYKKWYWEFNTGGARTGFTGLKDIEDYKKELRRDYEDAQRSPLNIRKLWHSLGDALEYANSCVEDMTRFATFVASRKSGRNVRRSVTDAKNITLNFNRKGNGEMGNQAFREMQIFVNPAIQSAEVVAGLATHHPVRFSLYTAMRVLIGVGTPMMTALLWNVFGGGGDGDDDGWNAVDEYWNLPSWQRRNNFVCWIPGTRKFFMIPLAQEFRVANGFGEAIASSMGGHSSDNPMVEALTEASGLLPLDFTGNGNNPLITLAPTIMQPALQIGFNTDFTGRPIYKDSEWNKYEPAWQKAYIGTPRELVAISEKINGLTGGNDHKQGWWEQTAVGNMANNPAVVDHALKGYFGGTYSMLAQLGGLAFRAWNGESPDIREVPMANRLVTAPREKQQNGKTKMPDWYYDMADESKRYQDEWSGYRKDWMAKKPGAKEHVDSMMKSEEFKMQMQVSAYINAINQIRAAQPTVENPQTEDEAKSKQELAEGLQHCLEMLEKIRKTGKALPEEETE